MNNFWLLDIEDGRNTRYVSTSYTNIVDKKFVVEEVIC